MLHTSHPYSWPLLIIIWGANQPSSQLRAELRRTRLQRVWQAGMQGCLLAASHIKPLWPQSTAKVESLWFFPREENRIVWKTLVAQQRTNAQLNSQMALAGNRTGVTLVRGERFTHKPTVPPNTLKDKNPADFDPPCWWVGHCVRPAWEDGSWTWRQGAVWLAVERSRLTMQCRS